MSVRDLIDQLVSRDLCGAAPSHGFPQIPKELHLPDDVREFYELAGGAILFRGTKYPIEIVHPAEFVRANPVIAGGDFPEDISFDWFIIAKSGDQYVTIDLHPERLGRCYDSFWDRHGVAGECAIVATSFTELLERLFEASGELWYWLREDYSPIGDAYDEEERVC